MNLDDLPFVGSYSGGVDGPGRRPRREPISLIVIHTNDGGPQDPSTGAEGLANYTAGVHPPDYPAYHVVVDSDSAIRTARDGEKVNGAGGVNERAWHLCLYGTAGQTSSEWHDAYSTAEIHLAAGLVREACDRFGVPKVRDQSLTRGICGHTDVSALHAESQGHTDPGVGFPWAEFLELVNGTTPPLPIPVEDSMSIVAYQNQIHTFWIDMKGQLQHDYAPGKVENMNAAYKVNEVFDRTVPVVTLAEGGQLHVRAVAGQGRLICFDYDPNHGWGARAAVPA